MLDLNSTTTKSSQASIEILCAIIANMAIEHVNCINDIVIVNTSIVSVNRSKLIESTCKDSIVFIGLINLRCEMRFNDGTIVSGIFYGTSVSGNHIITMYKADDTNLITINSSGIKSIEYLG